MDMIAHIYGRIGLCGWQTQMEEKPPAFSSETAPSGSSGQAGVCTLNSGGIWVLEPLGHCTIEKVITKTAACHHLYK